MTIDKANKICLFLNSTINIIMATGGGSFINKPARGWLHPDHLVSKEGITYAVRVSL